MVVQVKDGRAVSLRGDAEHPFTRGFLCQKVSHYLERVYHPDRLLYPRKRAGRKGAGQFVRIGWDEAISTIAARFREVADSKDGPQAILPYSYAGTMGKLHYASLDRRFFHRLGAARSHDLRERRGSRLRRHAGNARGHRPRSGAAQPIYH
jgi:anaerobic selenocysteine-containing dehydrogenase